MKFGCFAFLNYREVTIIFILVLVCCVELINFSNAQLENKTGNQSLTYSTIGTDIWELFNNNSGTIATTFIGIGSAVIAYLAYRFQKKRLDADLFIKVSGLLNDSQHRKARDILYHWYHNSNSLTNDDNKVREGFRIFNVDSIELLIELCKNMVRSDINEASTLVEHGYLSRNLFVREYYWIILKSWECLENEIFERRKGVGPKNYMENFERRKYEAEKYRKEIENRKILK
jgi:hypothetical protein